MSVDRAAIVGDGELRYDAQQQTVEGKYHFGLGLTISESCIEAAMSKASGVRPIYHLPVRRHHYAIIYITSLARGPVIIKV